MPMHSIEKDPTRNFEFSNQPTSLQLSDLTMPTFSKDKYLDQTTFSLQDWITIHHPKQNQSTKLFQEQAEPEFDWSPNISSQIIQYYIYDSDHLVTVQDVQESVHAGISHVCLDWLLVRIPETLKL